LILAVTALAVFGSSCKMLQSRDQINHGVTAFKNAQYPEAVEHFKTAVELDPNFTTARLYLATAYMLQYIPGAESVENNNMASAALEQFNKVLEQEPKNTTAMGYIASLYLNQKKWEDARQEYQKLIAVDPKSADSFYSLGFIAWSQWYPALGTAKAALGMKPEEGPIKDKKVKEELKTKYIAMVDSGIDSLKHCLDVNPEYDDAMVYMNLLVRERADLADSKEEYQSQIKQADDWMAKALATRKAKAEKKEKASGGGGITAEPTK
jgi:tetratricopeptide (TPR) repeat protein